VVSSKSLHGGDQLSNRACGLPYRNKRATTGDVDSWHLFERSADREEFRAEHQTYNVHDCNDRERNAVGDKSVFNGSDAVLSFENRLRKVML
jgi:hypothetical protein